MQIAAIGLLVFVPLALFVALVVATVRRRWRIPGIPATPGRGGGPTGGGDLGGDRYPRRPLVPAMSGAAARPVPRAEEEPRAPVPRFIRRPRRPEDGRLAG